MTGTPDREVGCRRRRGPGPARSVPRRTARRPPGVSRAGGFAPGTAASAAAAPSGSGALPADIDEVAAALGRPSRAAGVVAVEVAAAAPAAGVETEASSRLGTAAAGPDVEVEPAAQPASCGHRRVGRRVDVLADVARANPSTPPPADPMTTWR